MREARACVTEGCVALYLTLGTPRHPVPWGALPPETPQTIGLDSRRCKRNRRSYRITPRRGTKPRGRGASTKCKQRHDKALQSLGALGGGEGGGWRSEAFCSRLTTAGAPAVPHDEVTAAAAAAVEAPSRITTNLSMASSKKKQ